MDPVLDEFEQHVQDIYEVLAFLTGARGTTSSAAWEMMDEIADTNSSEGLSVGVLDELIDLLQRYQKIDEKDASESLQWLQKLRDAHFS